MSETWIEADRVLISLSDGEFVHASVLSETGVPELCVTKCRRCSGFCLTHRPTGAKLRYCFPNVAQAAGYPGALPALPWQEPPSVLVTEPWITVAAVIAKQMGGYRCRAPEMTNDSAWAHRKALGE